VWIEEEEACMNGPLTTEVRQSLTLLGSLAVAVGVPLGLGLLTVRILG
jgi:hypothetical protein